MWKILAFEKIVSKNINLNFLNHQYFIPQTQKLKYNLKKESLTSVSGRMQHSLSHCVKLSSFLVSFCDRPLLFTSGTSFLLVAVLKFGFGFWNRLLSRRPDDTTLFSSSFWGPDSLEKTKQANKRTTEGTGQHRFSKPCKTYLHVALLNTVAKYKNP